MGSVASVAGEGLCILSIAMASMTGEHVENHRSNCMMMLLAFWFCMLTVYWYIPGDDVPDVCKSTLLGFLVEEPFELTELASSTYTQPPFSLIDLAAGASLLSVIS